MGSERNIALWLLLAVKAALLGVLFVGVPLVAGFRPDAPAVEANVMTGRMLAFPFVVLVVPAGWLLARRLRGRVSYPYAADVLLTLPFLVDAASALAGAHDALWWWDELGHLGGWALLVAAFMLVLRRTRVRGWAAAGLGVGFGATTAILWELAEYLVFLRHTPEPMVTYEDTLGDLALGLLGSALAAALFAFVFWRRRAPMSFGLARGRTAEPTRDLEEDPMAPGPNRKLFVNLAVEDLDRSVEFFTRLGFTFNPLFTDETATCMVIGEDAFAMLLVRDRFRDFAAKELADPRAQTEALLAFSVESREEVDRLADEAIAHGGASVGEPLDHGFMYQRSFDDPDGHHWEVFWMDPVAAEQGPADLAAAQ